MDLRWFPFFSLNQRKDVPCWESQRLLSSLGFMLREDREQLLLTNRLFAAHESFSSRAIADSYIALFQAIRRRLGNAANLYDVICEKPLGLQGRDAPFAAPRKQADSFRVDHPTKRAGHRLLTVPGICVVFLNWNFSEHRALSTRLKVIIATRLTRCVIRRESLNAGRPKAAAKGAFTSKFS